MSRLLLSPALRAELELIAHRGYPYETCGLVLGHQESVDVHAWRVLQARNLDSERAADRYLLDPADFLAADQAARAEGLEIVGIWHSHPDHPARPSETDRQGAWEGWSYVILAVTRDGVTELRSWRLEEGAFVEEPIVS